MTQTGFRFEGDVAGCLKAFVAVHPAWAGDPHEITARAPGDEEATDRMSIDLVRACTRWAREHRYISADMATVFENAPDKYFDVTAGMKLRREIYEPGHSRDVNESILKFLGRERSIEPFLKTIGIKSK